MKVLYLSLVVVVIGMFAASCGLVQRTHVNEECIKRAAWKCLDESRKCIVIEEKNEETNSGTSDDTP